MEVEPKKTGFIPVFFVMLLLCYNNTLFCTTFYSHLALFSVIPASEPVSLPLSCYSGATKMPD